MTPEIKLPKIKLESKLSKRETMAGFSDLILGLSSDLKYVDRFAGIINSKNDGLLGPLTIGGQRIFFVAGYNWSNDIFQNGDKKDGFTDKGFTQKILIAGSRNPDESNGGVIGSSSESWGRMRKPLETFFRRGRFTAEKAVVGTYNRYAEWLGSLSDGETLNVGHKLSQLTLRSLMEDVFNIQGLEPNKLDGIVELVKSYYSLSISEAILPKKALEKLGIDKKFQKVTAEMNSFVDNIIAQNIKQGGDTVVTSLLAAVELYKTSGGKEGISINDLYDTMPELISAGHETTANTMVWLVNEISLLPEEKRQALFAAVKGDKHLLLKNNEWRTIIDKLVSQKAQTDLIFRGVTKDATITDGTRICSLHSGDQLIIFLGAATRNAQEHGTPDPDFVFAKGERVCVGKWLAKLHIAELVSAMADAGVYFKFPKTPKSVWKAGTNTPHPKDTFVQVVKV